MNQIKWPPGLDQSDFVGSGNFGFVCLDENSRTVIKSPHEGNEEAIQIEKAIYERFEACGSHAGLLRYWGPCGSGIRLEFAGNYGLRKYIQDHGSEIAYDQRLRWCQQIVDAVAFANSKGVIHGDLQWGNIFLDDALNAKVGDFAGSSLDGSDLLVAVTASHRYPGMLQSERADIFALGSTLFEIMGGQSPYDGRSDKEIQDAFDKFDFPKTRHLGPVGDIITRCWEGKYRNAYKVSKDIQALRPSNKPPHTPLLNTALCSKTVATITVSALGLQQPGHASLVIVVLPPCMISPFFPFIGETFPQGPLAAMPSEQ